MALLEKAFICPRQHIRKTNCGPTNAAANAMTKMSNNADGVVNQVLRLLVVVEKSFIFVNRSPAMGVVADLGELGVMQAVHLRYISYQPQEYFRCLLAKVHFGGDTPGMGPVGSGSRAPITLQRQDNSAMGRSRSFGDHGPPVGTGNSQTKL